MHIKLFLPSAFLLILLFNTAPLIGEHAYNGTYSERNTDKIAFPIGGIGAGNYFIEGNGSVSGISVKHRLDYLSEPTFFAAICVKGKNANQNQAKLLEGPVPEYKIFNRPGNAMGSGEKTYGLPRFTNAKFSASFPFCNIELEDQTFPLSIQITGFSPFIPNEPNLSGLPVGAIEYKLVNPTSETIDAVFSVHTRNFMGGNTFEKISGGYNVIGPDGKFAIKLLNNDENVHVDCCWFRGGWFDSLSIVWNNIQNGLLVDNPSDGKASPGASLSLPILLGPNESKTIKMITAWYVPTSTISSLGGNAFAEPLALEPSKGTAQRQQQVSGYDGKNLINTYDPNGDAHIGRIISPCFLPQKKYLYFKIGGGSLLKEGVAIQKKQGEEFVTVKTFRGQDKEKLEWVQYDLSELNKSQFRIYIFDEDTTPWGHINADSFVLSDTDSDSFFPNGPADTDVILADFENNSYGNWQIEQLIEASNADPLAKTYIPWYAKEFPSVEAVLNKFETQYDNLRTRSERFASAMKSSSLPPEIMEAIEANLAILKTPTILRQFDGRLWAWEGCQDSDGSCPGTCTHVWNYGQSIPHLFPSLERTFRQNEFYEGLTPEGRQAFRGNLPIIPGGTAWDASDGQLGTIMRLHREWRISGSIEFLKEYWPKVKQSLEFCIRTWDPNETGLLENSHHNTYDINYVGPEGHCGSFYLGALAAVCHMGEACGEDVTRYRELLAKGKKRYETELFNGEYFIQKVEGEGLEGAPQNQSDYYKNIAQEVNKQGPKYQYGEGCLSDGVLGFWIAKMCGIDEDLINPQLIKSHLLAVYKYNFKPDLSDHANPQRPTYAVGADGGLLLCSWPHNDKPYLPFPYSDEVWTGIEYQVASHLAFFGEYEKACNIVKTCRARYDGTKRNPFDEFECGHFYARATSSFGLFQGLTGVRYDAVEDVLFYRPLDRDFQVPVFTETGYGLVKYQASDQSVGLQVIEGDIPVQKFRKTE